MTRGFKPSGGHCSEGESRRADQVAAFLFFQKKGPGRRMVNRSGPNGPHLGPCFDH